MSTLKIRKDDHGLYVRTGGYLFRPSGETHHSFWDTVKAHHIGGTTTAKVGDEVWKSHGVNFYLVYDEAGVYQTTRFKKSTEVFNPKYSTT